jgi:hypothetical protein
MFVEHGASGGRRLRLAEAQAFLINVALGMGVLRPPAKVSFAQQPVSVELSSASLAEIVQTDFQR